MFEKETAEAILGRMMEKVPSLRDKREGSVIYDALMPAAIEMELLYALLDWYIDQSFGDTAERKFLTRLALERQMAPEEASYGIVKGEFSPSSLQMKIGERFSLETLNYRIIEKKTAGIYYLQCEEAGEEGNRDEGTLVPIQYISGLQSAKIIELVVPGEEEEGTEDFRSRYLKSFNNMAFGGNIDDYKEKVNRIQGIGGVKVYPIWQGGGTARVTFMTSEHKPPSPEFVQEVQKQLDPIPYRQQGVGIAPIGHFVTVEGVRDAGVEIGLNITYAQGYTFTDLKKTIEETIDGYFAELNAYWQETQVVTTEQFSNSGLVIRISQIESRLLELGGIEDVQDTKLNGQGKNLVLDSDELAVRGALYG